MTVVELNGMIDDTLAFFPELEWDKIPVNICRYNTPQVVDRIVIQVRGVPSVTIHTADLGEGK